MQCECCIDYFGCVVGDDCYFVCQLYWYVCLMWYVIVVQLGEVVVVEGVKLCCDCLQVDFGEVGQYYYWYQCVVEVVVGFEIGGLVVWVYVVYGDQCVSVLGFCVLGF